MRSRNNGPSRNKMIFIVIMFAVSIVMCAVSINVMNMDDEYSYSYTISAEIVDAENVDGNITDIDTMGDDRRKIFEDGYSATSVDSVTVNSSELVSIANGWHAVSIRGVTVLYDVRGPSKYESRKSRNSDAVAGFALMASVLLLGYLSLKLYEWYRNTSGSTKWVQ